MKYYSTQRPVVPGGYPKPQDNPIKMICNFDSREHCPEIGRRAWGYIEYERSLPVELAEEYELIPENCPPSQAGTLNREDYYKLLHERHARTNWNDLEQVKAYNEYASQLRKQLEWED